MAGSHQGRDALVLIGGLIVAVVASWFGCAWLPLPGSDPATYDGWGDLIYVVNLLVFAPIVLACLGLALAARAIVARRTGRTPWGARSLAAVVGGVGLAYAVAVVVTADGPAGLYQAAPMVLSVSLFAVLAAVLDRRARP